MLPQRKQTGARARPTMIHGQADTVLVPALVNFCAASS